jgi:hypothetical protein
VCHGAVLGRSSLGKSKAVSDTKNVEYQDEGPVKQYERDGSEGIVKTLRSGQKPQGHCTIKCSLKMQCIGVKSDW